MTNSKALRVAAIMGFLAVCFGAFGAHALHKVLASHGTQEIWEKAVFYHFIHTIMLVILAVRAPLSRGPWWSFLIGIPLFSGSLYVLALTRIGWLGAVTPFGGLSFLVGWGWLAWCSLSRSDPA